MTENLKSIVQAVNKCLKTDYNLISFDSLSEETLLQVLLDVFQEFGIVNGKWDVKENDPEETNRIIMESLTKIQYTDDSMDIPELRRGLVRGDKRFLFPIFEWIFENEDLITKLAYLARFLMPLNLPPEAISIPEVVTLFSQYEISMDEFKNSHQNYEFSVQESKKTRELRSDSIAIEGEIENVKKRIERLQTRLDKVPQQELLLEAARSLRIEKDQQRELQTQIDEQKQELQRASVLSDRLQKEYHNIRITTQGTSPQQMLDAIIEETQVLEFMVKQKLPQELLGRQTEVQILQEVIDEPNISRDYLSNLQYKVDDVSKEVQQMVETKMKDKSQQNDVLGLGPFRQQTALIARNKEVAAEQLDQLTRELNDVDNQLRDKQQKLQETVGEVILRGDDLKQFVNTLRAKSNIYKQQRSELASVKAESNDLMETLEGLRAQDPTLATNDEDPSSLEAMVSRPDSPVESRGVTELSRLVDGLQRAVIGAREKLAPMSQQLRPLRERIAELKDECDSKKQFQHLSDRLFVNKIVTVKTSPKPKRDIAKRVNKTLRRVVKINLLNVLNNTLTRPLTAKNKIKHKELIELRKSKIKEEFHGGSPSSADNSFNKENMSPNSTNVRFIEFSSPSTDSSPNTKPSLRQQLLEFAQKHNPKPEMFEDLLNIMKTNGLRIPRSPESFFDKKFDVVKLSFGSYLNIGIERGIKNYYRPGLIRKPMSLVTSSDDSLESSQPPETLLLDVAVYIVKSNPCNGLTVPQCMIIFGRINCQVFDDPFVIGIYYGSFPTPTIGNEIMGMFVSEMEILQKNDLVIGGNQVFRVKLNAIVSDPISNSLITCTSLPSSLYGCSKCNQKANLEIDNGYTSFPTTMTLATLRSDDDFKYLLPNDHHIAQPTLAQLDLGLISQFVLDYKIIVCKGVMKQMMNLWVNGRLDYRLNKETQQKISRDLIMMSGNCPREFVKRPRTLEEISLWDGDDWNEFLLYYSPIALKSRMAQKYYIHFLYLHLAMRILMTSDGSNAEANSFILGQLLNTFLADFTTLYGNDKVDYNIHNLLHFEQIQQKLGSLKKLNGFVYESQINMMNSFLDASVEINMEEIGEKIIENTNVMVENKINELINTSYPFVDAKGELVFKTFTISVFEPDNHVIMRDAVVKVEAICNDTVKREIIIIGRRYERVEIMFQAPLSSQRLLHVSSLSPHHTFKLSDFVCKANFDALNTQLSSETAQLQAEYIETEKELKKLEQKWQDLKLDYDRAEMLLEKARLESEGSPRSRRSNEGKTGTLKETLTLQLREQENIYSKLKTERDHIQSSKNDRYKQIEMWTDLGELFELKKKCYLEAKKQGIGGTLSFTNTSETFTLQ
ncbi:CLUMA_CG005968, isoform A [Clunio marinus]|uniref:CLUMA_CG005968, isoform A n=1 Tax=Clunio marinus TaxID=568069 RepID=A0A1J1I0P9_9DIPT|nr:CLUMA_CG005968, isoform A [Clunio marinus]